MQITFSKDELRPLVVAVVAEVLNQIEVAKAKETRFRPIPPAADSLTRKEAAVYLGLKASTLASWACLGKGPAFVRIGGAVRYRHNDLDAYIASNTVRSNK